MKHQKYFLFLKFFQCAENALLRNVAECAYVCFFEFTFVLIKFISDFVFGLKVGTLRVCVCLWQSEFICCFVFTSPLMCGEFAYLSLTSLQRPLLPANKMKTFHLFVLYSLAIRCCFVLSAEQLIRFMLLLLLFLLLTLLAADYN